MIFRLRKGKLGSSASVALAALPSVLPVSIQGLNLGLFPARPEPSGHTPLLPHSVCKCDHWGTSLPLGDP